MSQTTLTEIALDAIKENLYIAKVAMESKKNNNGCYGFPTVILLSSVIDIIGTLLCLGSNNTGSLRPTNHTNWYKCMGTARSHFTAVWNQYDAIISGYGITKNTWIDTIYTIYRCQSVHNGTIEFNTSMSINSGANNEALTVDTKTGHQQLHLEPFYDMVVMISDEFMKQYNNGFVKDTNFYNAVGIPDTGTTVSNIIENKTK
ncbi:MAG: hypothetical protein MJ009_05630 [Paludibacteraceae bacterium]|nr:hypothetical protein [Paludibacteraceae bacterium]